MKQNSISGIKIKMKTGVRRLTKRGFTLVEIMVVVAIIAIIALLAGPELINFGPNIRVKAAARDLHTNLQKMKVEAIKRNKEAVITFTPVAACPPTGSASPLAKYTITIDGETEDYDLVQNTAICPVQSLSATPPMGFKFTPQGLWLNILNATGPATFQIQNDKGRTYEVSVSIAGGISTVKL